MEGTSSGKVLEEMAEGIEGHIPLKGDIVRLEDCEERKRPIIVSTLVGKVINHNKSLNKGAVKQILSRAWGEPPTMM